MKTQNTTSNTAVAFNAAIVPVAATPTELSLPRCAANDLAIEKAAHYLELAEEASYWMIVVAAFTFQVLLVNLLTNI